MELFHRGKRSWVKGAALIESLWVVGLLGAVFFPLHLKVLRQGRAKLERLQEQRLRFDGLPRNLLGGGVNGGPVAPSDG